MSSKLKQPPLEVQVVGETARFTSLWKAWFTDLYRFLDSDTEQAITSARAVELDAKYVDVSKSGAGTYAITLAVPTRKGIIKTIQMSTTSGGGTVTMDLTNVVGGSAATTCTWDTNLDSIVLLSLSSKWLVLKENGVALT